jgi:hypothetical protein
MCMTERERDTCYVYLDRCDYFSLATNNGNNGLILIGGDDTTEAVYVIYQCKYFHWGVFI